MDRKTLKSKLFATLAAPTFTLGLGLGLGAACVDPNTFLPPDQAGSPAGVIDGVVTYVGPLPCTENNEIVGAALMLLFEENLLPPPEGLGTTAASLAVVGGNTLFGAMQGRLTFNPDGSRWCPDPNQIVNVGAPWAAAPLSAGVYEVRAFYDYDGNFDPGFSISNLPTRGDIGGGAIDNAADVLLGAAPKYRRIALGELVNEATGERKIPERGSRIGGVSVTLGLTLPLERPIFYPKNVYDEVLNNTDPNNVVLPADYQLPVFSPGDPAGTEQSLIRYGMAPGVKPEEVDTAAAQPFNLGVKSPLQFFYQWQDVNGDGVLSLADDHVPDSNIIPSLLPVTIFSKLIDEGKTGATGYTPQSAPVVIMQGLTIYKDLLSTALSPPSLAAFDDELIIGLRPAVLCLDPLDRSKGAVLLVTYPTDKKGNTILTSPLATKTALQKQFNREISIEFGCLPQGKYAMNAVYGTGQAWSVPNEAGICGPAEIPTKDGCKCGENGECGSRPIIPSQTPVLTIGPPDDPTYCDTQANLPEYKHKTLCFPQ